MSSSDQLSQNPIIHRDCRGPEVENKSANSRYGLGRGRAKRRDQDADRHAAADSLSGQPARVFIAVAFGNIAVTNYVCLDD